MLSSMAQQAINFKWKPLPMNAPPTRMVLSRDAPGRPADAPHRVQGRIGVRRPVCDGAAQQRREKCMMQFPSRLRAQPVA